MKDALHKAEEPIGTRKTVTATLEALVVWSFPQILIVLHDYRSSATNLLSCPTMPGSRSQRFASCCDTLIAHSGEFRETYRNQETIFQISPVANEDRRPAL